MNSYGITSYGITSYGTIPFGISSQNSLLYSTLLCNSLLRENLWDNQQKANKPQGLRNNFFALFYVECYGTSACDNYLYLSLLLSIAIA